MCIQAHCADFNAPCVLKLFQNFKSPSMDDKILEVVAVFGSMQLGLSRVMNLQYHRIAQVTILAFQK